MSYSGFVLDTIPSSKFTDIEITQINEVISIINKYCEENLENTTVWNFNDLTTFVFMERFIDFQ